MNDPGFNGIVVRTALNTTVARSLAGASAGLSISNANGVSGNPTLSLNADLDALASMASVGYVIRTGAASYAQRALQVGGTAGLAITNADGLAGPTSINLNATLDANGRVAVNKNSGSTVGTRRRINFIEGSNVTLTVADDAGNEEVDVTIAAAGGGGGGMADPGANGIMVRTALNVSVARSLAGASTGLAITNADGVAGNPTLTLDTDLDALAGVSAVGLLARTGSGTAAARSLAVGGSAGLTVSNSDGSAGNPTVSLSATNDSN